MNLESHEIVITVEAEEIHSGIHVTMCFMWPFPDSVNQRHAVQILGTVLQSHFLLVCIYRNQASQLRVRTHDFGCVDALVVPCRLGTHNYGDIIVRLWMTGCHYWQYTASVRIFGMYTNPSDLVQEQS